MLTCKALQKFSLEQPPDIMLGRAPDVQSAYDKFSQQKTNRGSFVSTMEKNLKGKKYYFVKNDFPYHTVDGIEHWVCWYKEDEENKAKKIISDLKSKYNVITCWKNLPHNCSIQEICHIHVFLDTY